MTPFDLLSRLNEQLAEDMAAEKPEPFDGNCENCGRTAEQFGGMAYPVTDSYKDSYHHCPVCRLLTVQAPNGLGIERYAGQTPIGFKLSSFKGGYLVIPEQGTPEVWLGGKYPDKLKGGRVKVRVVSGNAAKAALLEAAPVGLVIELSLRRERFTRYLSTSDGHTVRIATETGLLSVPLVGWPLFRDAMLALDKKTRAEALIIINGTASGSMKATSDRVQGFWQGQPELVAICRAALPDNPAARMFYVDAAKGAEA